MPSLRTGNYVGKVCHFPFRRKNKCLFSEITKEKFIQELNRCNYPHP
ncbi:unnamed protein product [Spirodela intermedia]|uniref:Uncharacterized protein n=2 Tax=Spirodela intermedia TaxID=51605 RepID=A0A7I8JDX4_SPIIN|nr:unnamed protein product [Spirodela intermedia]CAA6668358.1 unnamed protein product [Spirodela intermedia]CAA7405203.1 unnamed protein product [Spirodela intermedia]